MKRLHFFLIGIFLCIFFFSLDIVHGQNDFEGEINAKKPLQISTYDKTNQLNHPDVIYIPEGWNGFKYWMVFTPYPHSNSKHENPSIRVSDDGIIWDKPFELLPDPLVPAPLDGQFGGFNSDPELVLIENTMYCFYRSTSEDRVTSVYYKTSTDGIEWSKPHVTNLPPTTTSPAMYYDGTMIHCWLWSIPDHGKNHMPLNIASLMTDGFGLILRPSPWRHLIIHLGT